MNADVTYHSLVDRFKKTKRELSDAESTIRRLTGRDPDEISAGASKYGRSSSTSVSGRLYSGRKRSLYMSSVINKDEQVSADEESLDDEETPPKKPSLQSFVVATNSQGRTRKATIEEQNSNSKVKARNRRMFGALIGTLEKFQHEEKKRQHKESRRAEIEQKVEAATEEEKEKIKKEKELLFVTRREKQIQLRCLEKKIERAESHAVYDANHKHLLNFIRTKAKPAILFLPSSHTAATKKCLEASRKKIQELIKKRQAILESDLSEIEECYKKEALPSDKENKCPKDESESQDVPETESESLVVEQEDSSPDVEDDSSNDKNLGSLTDQEFEPIYD